MLDKNTIIASIVIFSDFFKQLNKNLLKTYFLAKFILFLNKLFNSKLIVIIFIKNIK